MRGYFLLAQRLRQPSFAAMIPNTKLSSSNHPEMKTAFDAEPHPVSLGGARLEARPSGALWWPARALLCVADLHLGKSRRMASAGGAFLPPYETTETLGRLGVEIDRLNPRTVVCLGDSFDDDRDAPRMTDPEREALRRLMAGRKWIWIAGNHDPAPFDIGGAHCAEHRAGAERASACGRDALVFRHIAAPEDRSLEISGHFHPKAVLRAQGRRIARRCFLVDGSRVVLPAFGAYTGGLDATDAAFDAILDQDAAALVVGSPVRAIPRAALSKGLTRR